MHYTRSISYYNNFHVTHGILQHEYTYKWYAKKGGGAFFYHSFYYCNIILIFFRYVYYIRLIEIDTFKLIQRQAQIMKLK